MLNLEDMIRNKYVCNYGHYTVIQALVSFPIPVFDVILKQGKSVICLFLKISALITIPIESSRRDLFMDTLVDELIDEFTFERNKLRSSPVLPSYPKQVWDYLKQGFVFTE